MKLEELTGSTIGCAYEVFNELGPGFLESVYEKALLLELRTKGVQAVTQHPLNVYYKGEIVGKHVLDLLVEDEVVVELKSVQKIDKAHEVQLVHYLAATKKEVGLLLNFSPTGVQVKRKLLTLD